MSDELGKVNLAEIKEPKFTIVLNDRVGEFDPWELSEKIGKESATLEESFDKIRQAFGFLTQAHVDEAKNKEAALREAGNVEEADKIKPLPITISRHQCMVLQQKLGEFINSLDVSKKLKELVK